ncbi:MFS transporter [Dyadobacter sandarakinus]|uniref:MFS transporter n=1 Tax=Dyadobacter sandarakinus TaxID=2747268 RepID=A0ABX7I3R4_9BACT|nr:MFS transporter [Dyadobacter sandarakinus]QRR00707.1 MFS transporter [Dyadobacter sandarakinus]
MNSLLESQRLRYFSFFYLYIMQGVPGGFALIAVTNYLSARHMDAGTIGTFGALVGLPWAFKFVWGPLVDRFQGSAMGRRRPWILAAQVMAFLASLALLLVGDPVADFRLLVGAFVVHGVFASLQDISVDALAITIVPEEERGRTNALMKIGMVIGQALGSAGLALIIHFGSFRYAVLTQSAVLFLLTLLTFFIKEEAGHARFSFKKLAGTQAATGWMLFPGMVRELARALLVKRSLLLFVSVAAVFVCERLFQRTFALHLIQKLDWTDTSVSVLSGTYGSITAVAVALLGGWLSDRIGALKLLVMVTMMMGAAFVAFSLASTLWIHESFAVGGLMARQTFESLFSIAALPVLMGVCRKSIAAAQFGFYMALSNQADVAGIYLSGPLFKQFPVSVIGLAAGLVIIMAAAMIGMLWQRKFLAAGTQI